MGVTWYAASQQGLIFARSTGFRYEGGNLPLFAHEMAHGWWGNLVGTDGPGSILCSESLAQYGAVIAIETLEGVDARNEFLRYSRTGYSGLQCANGYFYMWREGHDKPMRDLESGGWDHNLSDAKGHWVYHMLRHRVGDEVFFATLRGMIEDFAGLPMTLDDMRAAFIAAAPDQSLEAFFTQWLDRAGAPVLDFDWWAIENGKGVRIDIAQTQPGEPFHLDLDVEIEFLDGDPRTEVIELREMTQTFRIETDKRPVAIRLDPRYRQLIWRPEYGPRPMAAP
jgi:aminopeptidase N